MDELSRRLGDRAFDLPLPPDLTARVERGPGRRRRLIAASQSAELQESLRARWR